MHNPLHKRYARQLVHDAGRYIGIFVLLVVTISVTSGFLATISSIQGVLAEQQASSAIEDARVETSEPIDDDARRAAEDLGATLYDNWSRDASSTVDGTEATIRTYRNRTSVDIPSYFSGRAPEADDEIALDDTFCSYHGLSVGDSIDLDGKSFVICGIMVLPDYNTLLRSNSDFVMDVQAFSVALASDEGFERLSGLSTAYTYSLAFDDSALSLSGRVEKETDVAKALDEHGATVTNLLDREQNQCMSYLAADVDRDSSMYMVLLYVLVAIMAFIFVVLTNATVEQESSVIGTLRASGWRKGEIVRHYLFLPASVGLVGVVVGNVLGYTVVSEVAQGLYYDSYSLPPFHATFDVETFLLTSALPYALLVGITLVGLARKLGATPLAFLRHEVTRGKRRHNLRLPERLGYVARFRLRFLVRNASTFVTLFVGVLAGSFLVLFSLDTLPTFKDYADRMANLMPAEHVYVLKAPYELEMADHQQELRDQLARLVGIDCGAEALGEASEGLREGAGTLGDGVDSAASGASQLADGASELAGGADALASGSQTYSDGLASAASGQRSAADAVDLDALQAAYQSSLEAYVAACLAAYQGHLSSGGDPSLVTAHISQDPDVLEAQQALAASLTSLLQAAGEKGGCLGAATALEQARTSYQQLLDGTSSLAEGVDALSSGAGTLSSGMGEFEDGYARLSGGIEDYSTGVDELLDAASELGLSDMAEDLVSDIHPVAEEGTFSQETIGQAEKVCVASLEAARKTDKGEEDVSVYGIQEGSHYWDGLDVSDGRVLVGCGLLDKCGLQVGDAIVLYDKFSDKSYAFTIDAATGDSADLNVYMARDTFQEAFGYADDWFNAYASNEELAIDPDYLSSDITPQDMRDLANQMIDTFSDTVQLILVAAALVFFVVMYLLTKTVLDHSARSISLMKVFGYRNREVRRLYLSSVTLAVAISLVVGLPLAMWGVSATFEAMMLSYPGNFVVTYTPQVIVEDLAIGFATYVVVALLHMRRIRRVPLSLALKAQE